jgi:hypothetical protein
MLKDRAKGGHAIFYLVNNFLILILLVTMEQANYPTPLTNSPKISKKKAKKYSK